MSLKWSLSQLLKNLRVHKEIIRAFFASSFDTPARARPEWRAVRHVVSKGRAGQALRMSAWLFVSLNYLRNLSQRHKV